MRQVGMQIGAERRLGTATFESVDRYTGEPWAILPEATRTDVDDAVRAARAPMSTVTRSWSHGPVRPDEFDFTSAEKRFP
jgi:acyl-CoA reductase-like NAD-dependent aldehyde dehydrogenase